MDKKYFLTVDKKQIGPLTFKEISKRELKGNEKVWTDSFEDWKNVSEVEELRPFIIKMPPPITKTNDKAKIIAKEIKKSFKLLLVALIIGIVSYPIIAYTKGGFTSLSYKSKFKTLFKDYKITNTTDTSTTEPNADFIHKRDTLIHEVENFIPRKDFVEVDVQDYEHFNFDKGMYDTKKLFDYSTSLDDNINRSFGLDTITLSFLLFVLSSIILILGRYLINLLNKSIKWININGNKN